MRYSKEDKIFWVKLRSRGLGYCEIASEFKNNFPNKPKPGYRTVRALVEKFERTGSVENIYVNNRSVSKDTEIAVLAQIEVNLH